MSVVPKKQTGTFSKWKPPSPTPSGRAQTKKPLASVGRPLGTRRVEERDRGPGRVPHRSELFVGRVSWQEPHARDSKY